MPAVERLAAHILGHAASVRENESRTGAGRCRQLERLLVGSTFKRINVSDIKALTIIVPPRPEQDAICRYLDSELARFDGAIGRMEQEIDLLREYRTRLVADVVTGKLDVREAAARLPEEGGLAQDTFADGTDSKETDAAEEAA